MSPLAQQMLTALAGLLPLVVAWLARRASQLLARKTYAADVDTIGRRARAVVASLQREVDNLKHAERPGTWDSTEAARVRTEAVACVRRLEPLACRSILAALDGDEAALNELVSGHVEESVRSLRRTEAP